MAKTIIYRHKIENRSGEFITTGYASGHESYIVRLPNGYIFADVYRKAVWLGRESEEPIRIHEFPIH